MVITQEIAHIFALFTTYFAVCSLSLNIFQFLSNETDQETPAKKDIHKIVPFKMGNQITWPTSSLKIIPTLGSAIAGQFLNAHA